MDNDKQEVCPSLCASCDEPAKRLHACPLLPEADRGQIARVVGEYVEEAMCPAHWGRSAFAHAGIALHEKAKLGLLGGRALSAFEEDAVVVVEREINAILAERMPNRE